MKTHAAAFAALALWAISEAGSRKYKRAGDPDFPFIFQIDVGRLAPTRPQ